MRTAVTEALVTLTQALPGSLAIAYEATVFIEPAETFLRANLLPAIERPQTVFGPQLHVVGQGIWQITVNGPAAGASPAGPGPVNAVVDNIKVLFRPGTVLSPTTDPNVQITLQAVEDGPAIPGLARYTVPVSVVYRASWVH